MTKRFITDFGSELVATDTATGKVDQIIPRYGVWGPDPHRRNKPICLEVSSDLEYLQTVHGPLIVYPLTNPTSS